MRPNRNRLVWRIAAAAFAVVLALPALVGQTLQIDSTTADWIEGFVDFVRWEMEENQPQITIGVLGSPEVANYLERRSQSRTSKPDIRVIRLQDYEQLDGVNVLFVGSGNRRHWPAITRTCQERGILSIGEQDGFVENGGCIEFAVRRNRIVFRANPKALRKSEIDMKSQLLELAENQSQ